jgi:hypothetical protein
MSDKDVVTLYRPVGQAELDLIMASDWKAFPPRLEFQPIFYPVLSEEYATQIARDWNTKDPNSGYAGYVTAFEVERKYLDRYEIHTVGSRVHQEYWILAADLNEFNLHIVGAIRVIAEYFPSS